MFPFPWPRYQLKSNNQPCCVIPLRNREADEITSVEQLVKLGGRFAWYTDNPKIPILLPGCPHPVEKRDILLYYKDYLKDPGVAINQLESWRYFRKFRLSSRSNFSLAECIRLTTAQLERANIVSHLGLKQDPDLQDKLVTWLEYLAYAYRQYETFALVVLAEKPNYERAIARLRHHGLKSVTDTDGMPSYYPYEERLAVKEATQAWVASAAESAERRLSLRTRRDSLLTCQLLLSQFRILTAEYRYATVNATRQAMLLRWIMDEVLDIKDEQERNHIPSAARFSPAQIKEARARLPSAYPPPDHLFKPPSPLPAPVPEHNAKFERFRQLPAEIRIAVWEFALPPTPTVHFFDLVHPPLPCHLMLDQARVHPHSRIVPSTVHDSGYLPVYALLATCKEARYVVISRYKSLHPSECPKPLEPVEFSHHAPAGNALNSPQAWSPTALYCPSGCDAGTDMDDIHGAEPREEYMPDFTNFSWLPRNDMVLIQIGYHNPRSRLPKQSLTFGYRGPVNLAISAPRAMIRTDEGASLWLAVREAVDKAIPRVLTALPASGQGQGPNIMSNYGLTFINCGLWLRQEREHGSLTDNHSDLKQGQRVVWASASVMPELRRVEGEVPPKMGLMDLDAEIPVPWTSQIYLNGSDRRTVMDEPRQVWVTHGGFAAVSGRPDDIVSKVDACSLSQHAFRGPPGSPRFHPNANPPIVMFPNAFWGGYIPLGWTKAANVDRLGLLSS